MGTIMMQREDVAPHTGFMIARVRAHVCAHARMNVCACARSCVSERVCAHLCACMFVHTSICAHVCARVYVCVGGDNVTTAVVTMTGPGCPLWRSAESCAHLPCPSMDATPLWLCSSHGCPSLVLGTPLAQLPPPNAAPVASWCPGTGVVSLSASSGHSPGCVTERG